MLQKCSNLLFSMLVLTSTAVLAANQPRDSKPDVYIRILQLEDARSLGNGELETLLQHPLAEVRVRATLALGRIGDKRATPALLKALAAARTPRLRLITVFALGEMEDAQAVPALLEDLQQKTEAVEVRTRAVEALGKIASLAPNVATLGPEKMEQIGQALIAQLPAPDAVLTPSGKQLGWLTITALMRVKPAAAVEPLTRQLKARNASLRAAAANALARWGQAFNSTAPALIESLADRDVEVRANSARALGQSKSPAAYEPLVKLLADPNDRVQVNTVRALAALADRRVVEPLQAFGEQLLKQYQQAKAQGQAHPHQINLLLEIVPALGVFKDKSSVPFFQQFRAATGAGAYPEIETALLNLGGEEFWQGLDVQTLAQGDASKAANLIAILGGLSSERAKAALPAVARATAT
jgi:deoxyhypusine monooxygenase